MALQPSLAQASSSWGFPNDWVRHTRIGRTPLEGWSAPCRDLCLTSHNSHKGQTSIPSPPCGIRNHNPRKRASADPTTGTGRGQGSVEIQTAVRFPCASERCNRHVVLINMVTEHFQGVCARARVCVGAHVYICIYSCRKRSLVSILTRPQRLRSFLLRGLSPIL
jgi:hypothetical protein